MLFIASSQYEIDAPNAACYGNTGLFMPKKDSPEFNINKVAAEFVQNNIENFVRVGTGVFKTASDKIKLHLDRTYKAYLKCVAEKCSRTKSFLIRGEPVYLYQF